MVQFMEDGFEKIGFKVASNPWKTIGFSIFITMAFGYGFALLENETRAEKQWVPDGAVALDHKDYADAQWPSSQRFNIWVATCKKDKPDCNMMEAKYVKELNRIHQNIKAITINGKNLKAWDQNDKILKGVKKPRYFADMTDEQFEKFNGTYMFTTPEEGPVEMFYEGDKIDANYNTTTDEACGTWGEKVVCKKIHQKCFKFGPFCGMSSPLQVFREDTKVLSSLTNEEAFQAWNYWERQENSCPVSIAKLDSPCLNAKAWAPAAGKMDCQKYKTPDERKNCRDAATKYCDKYCPKYELGPTCLDNGCPVLSRFEQLEQSNAAAAAAANETEVEGEGAPESAFAFEPFKIRTVASSGWQEKSELYGPLETKNSVKDAREFKSASAMMGFYALSYDPIRIKTDSHDPVAELWELHALCEMGIAVTREGMNVTDCPGSELIDFSGSFGRSFTDEFGAAILGDLAAFGAACGIIIVYMVVMLSKRDHVHSKLLLGLITVAIVGMSYGAAMGFGAYLGKKNNNLIQLLPFLLLGLGVDDAFVLMAEYHRATREHPKASVEKRIALATRHGGMSILITSVTDAFAFGFGSFTVLPALSWFCSFAGIGVAFCFLFQLTMFLPCLTLDEKRAEHGIYDLTYCCFTCCRVRASEKLDKLCIGTKRLLELQSEASNSDNKIAEAPKQQSFVDAEKGDAQKPGSNTEETAISVLPTYFESDYPSCLSCSKTDSKSYEFGAKYSAKVHQRENGAGCCFCLKCADGILPKALVAFLRVMFTLPGKIFTAVFFTTILIFGIYGSTQIYADFKLEWFIPNDSYVNVFFGLNEKYFKSGTSVTVYLRDFDYHKNQEKMHLLEKYLLESPLVDQDIDIGSWYQEFTEGAKANANNTAILDDAGKETGKQIWFNYPAVYEKLSTGATLEDGARHTFKDADTFYNYLHAWYMDGGGARYRDSIQWTDDKCHYDVASEKRTEWAAMKAKEIMALPPQQRKPLNMNHMPALCDHGKGLKAGKISFTFALKSTDTGVNRYASMIEVRKKVDEMFGKDAFPYSREFLYWEETGVIGVELVRNMISCFVVIVIIIAILIPAPKIAACVIFVVLCSIIELVGFMHLWGVSISGVSTIYILLAVGLAVDYSAHIAHMFCASSGTAQERSIAAVERIGPSVFNAIFSTLLAVCVLSTSKSFVFVIFFKALTLIVAFGGLGGIWLLPIMLGMLGGASKDENLALKDGARPKSPSESSTSVNKVGIAVEKYDNFPNENHQVESKEGLTGLARTLSEQSRGSGNSGKNKQTESSNNLLATAKEEAEKSSTSKGSDEEKKKDDV